MPLTASLPHERSPGYCALVDVLSPRCGALADPGTFLNSLSQAGIQAHVERQVLGFDFDDFESAWEVLAGVTTAQLPPERREEAKTAVRALMWPADSPKHFTNMTQFIIASRLTKR
jgi:hypothetical protein